MKRIKCIALVSALVLAAGGCSDDPELYITLPESQSKVMNIDAKTQSITVNVEHNVDMEVTISEEATWLTQGGTTENTYTFNAAENDDTAERKATITFANTANGLSQTVEVTQAGAEPAIVISNPKVELAADSTFTVEVKHNVEVEVAISEEASEWLTQVEAETRAMTTNTYTFNAAENPDTTARKATITFTDKDSNLCDTVEVTQAGRELEEVNIPDRNFKKYCLDKYDSNNDLKITEDEVAKVTVMDVHSEEIRSLKGIEYFTGLETLDCSGNHLTSLDVSKNTALTILDCMSNKLDSLDISKNTKLTHLTCSFNNLTSLDVSKNTELTLLISGYNPLMSIDVSKNTKLTRLTCGYNQLTSLDVSQNMHLSYLGCGYNQLTNLDVSQNTELDTLNCYENQLTNLDVSGCTALTMLWCSKNQLTNLDVSGCTALTALKCGSNKLVSLDVSNCGGLKELDCFDNKLESLILNTKLIDLKISFNNLTSLDIENNELTSLDCSYNKLTSLNVSSPLTLLKCYGNLLDSLDVSKTNLVGGEGYPLDCAPMNKSGKNLLKTLILKKDWKIKGINNPKNTSYIPKETEIVEVE